MLRGTEVILAIFRANGYAELDRRQAAWVNRLARGIERSDLETTARVLDDLSTRLEAEADAESDRARSAA
jgi:hypothetical protein